MKHNAEAPGMFIIGAGLSGLIAGHHFRHHRPLIVERQGSLPNNHDALLRFRSDKVSKGTGIPFKKVLVRKGVIAQDVFVDKPNQFVCNQYSLKVTGSVQDRSIWNFGDVERYVAPPDLVPQLAHGLPVIAFNRQITETILDEEAPVISTMPMPALMDLVHWKHKPKFTWRPIWTCTLEIISPFVDVYQSIYYSDLDKPYYRASLTGNIFQLEFVREVSRDEAALEAISVLANHFGMSLSAIDGSTNFPTLKRQEFGKINPINEEMRQDFIYSMTRDYGIYSLGRFATWRQILLDDVVDDCAIIGKLITAEGRRSSRYYQQALIDAK